MVLYGAASFLWCSTSYAGPIAVDDVAEIAHNAFISCNKVTHIALPQTLRAIRGQAFQGCSLLKTMTLPKFVRTVATTAFYGTRMESLYIASYRTAFDATTFASSTLQHLYINCLDPPSRYTGLWPEMPQIHVLDCTMAFTKSHKHKIACIFAFVFCLR